MGSFLPKLAFLSLLLLWVACRLGCRFRVTNYSMLPTLTPGDRILVNRLVYHWRGPRRGEIVLFRHPELPAVEAVKRVVGLPGERIVVRTGAVFVDGARLPEPYLANEQADDEAAEWLLRADEFVVLGDNRRTSRDSRHFGPIRASLLQGRAWYRYAPRQRRGPFWPL